MKMILITFILFSCSTGYHAKNVAGGFEEKRIDHDSYYLKFSGNSVTGDWKIKAFFLLRAAELAYINEYQYFSIAPLDGSKTKGADQFEGHQFDQAREGIVHFLKTSRSNAYSAKNHLLGYYGRQEFERRFLGDSNSQNEACKNKSFIKKLFSRGCDS